MLKGFGELRVIYAKGEPGVLAQRDLGEYIKMHLLNIVY